MVSGNIVIENKSTESSVLLGQFIAGVRRIIRAEGNGKRVARAVAELLEPYLKVDYLLTEDQMQPDAEKYRQNLLHVESDGSFSIAALVWKPGQETPIHNHVSWCVVGVYKGDEYETRYELCHQDGQVCLIETGNELNREGTVNLPVLPGDIHKVANAGSDLAVSIHIYGADRAALGCSNRRCYNERGRLQYLG
jgi:predicted metal-dependent enzyme (double-stranded beta helix superfamily)